jgi:glycosyltransferase
MAMTMKISIITVCFNSAKTIACTLKSVTNQTHSNVEHILIDGASRDNTLAIVHGSPSRPSRIVSERDAGIYDAMNKGLGLATGDFVGFLNADDMLAGPNAIASIAAAASRSEVDAIYGDLSYVHKDRPTEILRYWRSGEFTTNRLRYGWMPPHPTFYVRRSAIHGLGQFDLRFRIAADYDFMLRYLSRPGIRVAYVPEVLVHMRAGGASNRTLGAMMLKSREDLAALKKNQIGGIATLMCKNARKLPQFFQRPRHEESST